MVAIVVVKSLLVQLLLFLLLSLLKVCTFGTMSTSIIASSIRTTISAVHVVFVIILIIVGTSSLHCEVHLPQA